MALWGSGVPFSAPPSLFRPFSAVESMRQPGVCDGNAAAQYTVERSQLVRCENIARLLHNPLVALRHLLQEIVNVRLRSQKCLVRCAVKPIVNSFGSALTIWRTLALWSAVSGADPNCPLRSVSTVRAGILSRYDFNRAQPHRQATTATGLPNSRMTGRAAGWMFPKLWPVRGHSFGSLVGE